MVDVDIELDYSRDSLIDAHGLARLRKGYLAKGETSPQERFAFLAKTFGSNPSHAQRMYDYMSKLWWSCSTPVLAYGKNDKGLPISCFLAPIHDNVESLIDTSSETRRMTVGGGGVGLYLGIRERGKKSSGVVAHMKTYDADTLAFKQAETRRGAYAGYLDVSHPEIVQFMDIRNPTGGDLNQRALNMHIGVNLTDDFMNRVKELATNTELSRAQIEELDKWPLISPENGEIVGYESVKRLWMKHMENRVSIGGEPYCHFIDTSNRFLPGYQKELGLKVNQYNLWTEITLATGKDNLGGDRAAVCCLGSVNLAHWEEIKLVIKQFMADVVEFLDNVLQRFIDDAAQYKGYERAVYSAMRERAIGIGGLGWHDLLQQKNLPFASPMAIGLNKTIWKTIKQHAMEANIQLANDRGACPDSTPEVTITVETGGKQIPIKVDGNVQVTLATYGKPIGEVRAFNVAVGMETSLGKVVSVQKNHQYQPVRCSHLLAIAPNASSSIIMGTSPSVEPYRANAYMESGDAGMFVAKNHNLEQLLESYGQNTDKVWQSIVQNDGSVQHLDFLDEWDKEVYLTFLEIDQRAVVQQAADRQVEICQAQSVNLAFRPDARIEEVAMIHLLAWILGLKSLYYCRSETLSKAKVGGKSERARIDIDVDELARQLQQQDTVCVACE